LERKVYGVHGQPAPPVLHDDSEHRDVSAAAEACEYAKLAVHPATQRHTPQVIPMTVVRWKWSA
jgi:hypothetical protein